jgi:integration host factor subunit alpha
MYSTKQCIVADWTRPGGRGKGVNASVIHFRLRLRRCVLSTGFRAGPENWSPGRYPQRRPHTSAPDEDFESRTRPGHSPAKPRRRVKVESARLVEWVFSEITDCLERGESVKLSSFGSFVVRSKGPQSQDGVEVPITRRRVMVFKASDTLRKRLVGEGVAN